MLWIMIGLCVQGGESFGRGERGLKVQKSRGPMDKTAGGCCLGYEKFPGRNRRSSVTDGSQCCTTAALTVSESGFVQDGDRACAKWWS